jgi:hypothetical protein
VKVSDTTLRTEFNMERFDQMAVVTERATEEVSRMGSALSENRDRENIRFFKFIGLRGGATLGLLGLRAEGGSHKAHRGVLISVTGSSLQVSQLRKMV